MENTNFLKIYSGYNNLISLNVAPGHFATSSSHINYYIDMTTLKCRSNEARAVAKAMVQDYMAATVIDTIVCMDGTQIIGAYLAEELSNAGIMSANSHQTIYVVTPEQTTAGQLIFKDNYMPMIKGKNVLLLLATSSTGKTVKTALECIEYYGGVIAGISSIFSAANKIYGKDINTIFQSKDLMDYGTYSASECPMCKAGIPINALVNSHGYSKL